MRSWEGAEGESRKKWQAALEHTRSGGLRGRSEGGPVRSEDTTKQQDTTGQTHTDTATKTQLYRGTVGARDMSLPGCLPG